MAPAEGPRAVQLRIDGLRTVRLRTVRSVIGCWGLGAALVAAVALCVVGGLAGDVYVALPFLRNKTIVAHLLPVLTAMALGFVLVDRMPELTLLAPVPLRMSLLRLAGAVLVALPVLVTLTAAGWTVAGASVVLGMLGVAALSAGLLGPWYWVPFFVIVVGWAQGRSPVAAATAGPGWLLVSLALLVGGGGSYLAIGWWRVRRLIHATGARTEGRCDLDTMRP